MAQLFCTFWSIHVPFTVGLNKRKINNFGALSIAVSSLRGGAWLPLVSFLDLLMFLGLFCILKPIALLYSRLLIDSLPQKSSKNVRCNSALLPWHATPLLKIFYYGFICCLLHSASLCYLITNVSITCQTFCWYWE